MREEYDFSKMKGEKNPYVDRLREEVTLQLGVDVVEYFKQMSEVTEIPYQNLINLYLRDCVEHHRKLTVKWAS
ncbi:MAG: antitoxin [bacterium]|nr:antitoxin [bacterium]